MQTTEPQTPRHSVSASELLPLVDSVVRRMIRYLPAHIDEQDLISAGRCAVIEAINDTNAANDGSVLARCELRVRSAVLDELRHMDPLSRHSRAKVRALRSAVEVLEVELGRAPTLPELATKMGISVAAVASIERMSSASMTLSLDGPAGTIAAAVPDLDAPTPAELAEWSDASTAIQAALSRLPAGQALALRRYYLEDATLDEIAAELGVTRARAHQIRAAGEKALRSDLAILSAWAALIDRKAR